MKQRLYEMLVPGPVRAKIYRANVRRYIEEEACRLLSVEESIPRAELSSVYIANIRVLKDRFAWLQEMPKGAVVAEIGVGKGDFSSVILDVTKPRELHLLDSWQGDSPRDNMSSIIRQKFGAEIRSGQVVLGRGWVVSELAELEDGYFDWIYLNADPSYEYMAKALEVCRKKVKEDGIISGQNYTVGSWLTRERYGVVEAVNAFCKRHRWEMIFLTHESHRHLSYGLRKIT